MKERVIPVNKLPKNIGATSREILKVIALHLGEDEEKFVDFGLIARSINEDRDTVRKSVKRMVKANVLRINDKKLSIPGSILVNVPKKGRSKK